MRTWSVSDFEHGAVSTTQDTIGILGTVSFVDGLGSDVIPSTELSSSTFSLVVGDWIVDLPVGHISTPRDCSVGK